MNKATTLSETRQDQSRHFPALSQTSKGLTGKGVLCCLRNEGGHGGNRRENHIRAFHHKINKLTAYLVTGFV